MKKEGDNSSAENRSEGLVEEILRLKKERNAVIMAHYYQRDEIQEIADFIGDSLALARQAQKIDADVIVMCGVHFMGETAKILCPDKTVLIPDPEAGCSLAERRWALKTEKRTAANTTAFRTTLKPAIYIKKPKTPMKLSKFPVCILSPNGNWKNSGWANAMHRQFLFFTG